jgi:hypothetical protein
VAFCVSLGVIGGWGGESVARGGWAGGRKILRNRLSSWRGDRRCLPAMEGRGRACGLQTASSLVSRKLSCVNGTEGMERLRQRARGTQICLQRHGHRRFEISNLRFEMQETADSNAGSDAKTQSQNRPVVNPGPYGGNCWLGVDRKVHNSRKPMERALRLLHKTFTCISQRRE